MYCVRRLILWITGFFTMLVRRRLVTVGYKPKCSLGRVAEGIHSRELLVGSRLGRMVENIDIILL